MDRPVHDGFVIFGIPTIHDLAKGIRHFEGECEMRQKECVAMVLAGGNGERPGALTNDAAKPAVYFVGI